MYRYSSKIRSSHVVSSVFEYFERFGLRAAILLAAIELVWAASVLVPVLAVIGALFSFTNAWLAILPGFLGAVTFLIILTIGGFAASLPSAYVARWRERMTERFARQYPLHLTSSRVSPVVAILPDNLNIQDAD
jgi:hypothetical protein